MGLPRYYKTPELAARLGLHEETLRRYAARGELRPVRVGRDLLWPEDEVAAWLESRRVGSRRPVVVALERARRQTRRTRQGGS